MEPFPLTIRLNAFRTKEGFTTLSKLVTEGLNFRGILKIDSPKRFDVFCHVPFSARWWKLGVVQDLIAGAGCVGHVGIVEQPVVDHVKRGSVVAA